MSDLERLRAGAAHQAGMEIRAMTSARAYRQRIRSLPAEIVINGLGQALAMLVRDGASDRLEDAAAARTLMEHLQAWLCRGFPASPLAARKGPLVERITTCSDATYVWAGVEAQAYLRWLKKFAEAYLADADDGGRRG